MKKLMTIAAALIAATSVHAADLGPSDIQKAIETYKANELRFTRDYVGKSIEFTWVLNKVSSQLFGNGYRVSFGKGGFSGGVDCIISDQTMLDTIVEWNRGQRVNVYGVVKDVTVGDLQLKQCKVTAIN